MNWHHALEWLCGLDLSRRLGDRFFRAYALRRWAELEVINVAQAQEQTLLRLVRKAQSTRFGKEHDFQRIRSIADYRRLVPLRTYEAFWKDYWQPAFPLLQGITWPEPIPYFALSSGTTSGTTKYLPVSRDMLASNRRAALTLLSAFAKASPDAHLFQGRMFFLGGSTDLEMLAEGVHAGDLSAIAVLHVPAYLRPYSFPPLDLALLKNWEQKLEAMAIRSIQEPITLLSGVPSWLLLLFERVKKLTGKATVAEVWPMLRLVIHGGIKFAPYRELFQRELGDERIRCLETYPCSEGFVGFEEPRHGLLRPIPDHGLFYEFVPLEELGQDHPTRHSLAEVETGVQYAVVLTTCAGLWGYVVGDTVAFERRSPPLFRFTGRTKYYLSAFGEHLISEEVEQAITAAARTMNVNVVDFHLGPVFPTAGETVGHHRYLIEFMTPPTDLVGFVRLLDEELNRLNEDYRAHRGGNLGMLPPRLWVVKPGGFRAWMRAHGKLGGQHKLPRMDPSGHQTHQMSTWLQEHTWIGEIGSA
jgi:hypothetical protein